MSTLEFQNLFDKHTHILHAFAYNLTKNIEESKDLFQETALRAIANREKFAQGTNLKAWLMTIMKNIFINNYRKKVKANTVIDSSDNQFLLNSGHHTDINNGDTNILIKELKYIINNLDESVRVPFLMHFEGYKYQEIAEKFELPLGTVKSRIFFARKEMKAQLKLKYPDMYQTLRKQTDL